MKLQCSRVALHRDEVAVNRFAKSVVSVALMLYGSAAGPYVQRLL